MSAERAPAFATVVSLGACTTESEILHEAGGLGAVIGTNVVLHEARTGDFAIIEASAPEQLERLAAELVCAAQRLREARAIKAGKVGRA